MTSIVESSLFFIIFIFNLAIAFISDLLAIIYLLEACHSYTNY